jgi:hypothetical protein
MSSKVIMTNILRVVLVIFAQLLVFKHISVSFADFAYIHFIIYPIAFLMLPMRTPTLVILPVAFLIGLLMDIFYDSIGVHASASVFSAYIRTLIIGFLEPFDGYNQDDVPTMHKMGTGWYVSFMSLSLIAHIFFYFSVEAFSFVYFFDIFLNTIFSFIVSALVIFILMFIFRTKA